MKTLLTSLAVLASLAPAWAQSARPERRHELTAGGGPMGRTMLDRQASPLAYRAKGPAFGLSYAHRTSHARPSLELQALLGHDLPRRYGVRRFNNGQGTYTLQSAYYGADVRLRYLRRLPAPAPEKLHLFVGAGLQNSLQISDAVANLYWGMNVAGLYAAGRAEYEAAPRQHFTAELALPVGAAVTRHTYANYPKSTDEGNLAAFFSQGTHWALPNRLQQVQASLGYQYTLFDRLSVGLRYQFQWLRYPAPQPIRSYDQRVAGQLGFQF
jgi:hypothetical protein